MVPVHAVHDTLEIIRLPRQTLEGRRKRIGAPPLGLVPVIDSGVHRPGNKLLRPVGRAHEPADLKTGAAVSPLRQFVGGGLLIRHHRQVGDACRGHTRRPEPHHVPARKVLRAIRHSRTPLVLLIKHGKRPGSRNEFSLQCKRRRSTTESAARKGTFQNGTSNTAQVPSPVFSCRAGAARRATAFAR